MIKKLLLVAVMVCSYSLWAFKLMSEFEQGTVYVAQETGDDANDGTSWGKAKKTLQAGIDAAGEGYTVLVAQGDYGRDASEFTDRTYNARTVPTLAYIDKKILVKSVEGREKTFITGAWATGSGSQNGVGDGAKRCVFMTVSGAAIEGFTIRRGSNIKKSATAIGTGDNTGAADYLASGGGVGASVGTAKRDPSGAVAGYTANPAYVINCIIEDCRSFQGPAIALAVPINCIIRHNLANGGGGHAAYRVYCSYNCIWVDNGPQLSAGSESYYVIAPSADHSELCGTYINNNCSTFVGPAASEPSRAFNTAFLGNFKESTWFDSFLYATNCVTTDTGCKRASEPGCVGGVVPYQMVSPLDDDYRPVAGGALIGAGSKDVFAWAAQWVPEEYIDKDHYGNPRPFGKFDPAIDVGAVQSTNGTGVVMEECGYVMLGRNVRLTIDGKSCEGGWHEYNWKGFEKHPCKQARISYIPEHGQIHSFYFYYYYSSRSDQRRQYPDMGSDNGMYITLPNPKNTSTPVHAIKITVTSADGVKYVQAGLKDYSAADGTLEHPYETIQEGVDASKQYGLVRVGPGVYDKGYTYPPSDDAAVSSQDTNSTPNRVYVGKDLRIVGTAGAAKTIIRGAHDNSSSGAYSGCGPKAIRCVLAKPGIMVVVQGFTLADGATDGDLAHRGAWSGSQWYSSDNSARGNFGGGGFRAGGTAVSERSYLMDSIVSNCVAYWGGALYGAQAQRCLFTCNTAVDNDPGSTVAPYGIVDKSVLRGCIVKADNHVSKNQGITGSCKSKFTSVCGMAYGGPAYMSQLADNSTPTIQTSCADPANGDFRLRSGSYAMNRPALRDESNIWVYDTTGYDGPIMYNPSNCLYCMAGAIQTEVAFAIDIMPESGTGAEATKTVLYPGETTTITATGTDRDFQGFMVGEEFIAQSERTYEFTAPPFDFMTYYNDNKEYPVKPVYTGNLYVDAVNGSDDNFGWKKSSPLKTLAYALTQKGVRVGDVVHCAEGVYNVGMMKRATPFNGGKTADIVNGARVVLTNGVTLVADGARENTIIEGYPEPGSPSYPGKPEWGLGPNALRCVDMYPNAKIKGFTLRKGATDWSNTKPTAYVNENCYGAGVFCADTTATIEDCTIEECRSRYAGAAQSGTLIGCKVVHCAGTSAYGGVANGKYYSCYFDWCFDQVIGVPYAVENCTIGPNCWLWDTVGSKMEVMMEPRSGVSIVNSLMMSLVKGNRPRTYTAYNSVWIEQTGVTCTGENNTFITSAEAATLLDENLVPVYSEDSIVLDKGDSSLVTAVNTHDVNGIQRIYNGAVDIGAGEYDWRPIYERALFSRKGAKLAEASAQTVATNGNEQVLVAGGKVEVKWPSAISGPNSIVDFTVTGAGTMKVYVNGELDSEYTSADGAKRLRVNLPEDAKVEIAYERAAGDGEGVGALLSAVSDRGGMAIILRPLKSAN